MNPLNAPFDALHLELLTLATSPAVHEEQHDGWVLRASGTDTRRANSVTQLRPGRDSLPDKIAYCEDWYRRHAQSPTFRLTSVLSPPSLDPILAERGYDLVTPSHVMAMPIRVSDAVPFEPSNVRRRTLVQGIADLHELKGSDPDLAARDIARQQTWMEPERHLAWFEREEPVACGMARVSGDWAGIFNMRTATGWRGRGIAGQLLGALLRWSATVGARHAFLQVEQANRPALSLYRRHGFAVCYDYHYRVRDVG